MTGAEIVRRDTVIGPRGVHSMALGDYVIEWVFTETRTGCPDAWYWMLYRQDARVNGGIACDPVDARRKARDAMDADCRQRFRAAHFWDTEEGAWLLREEA